MFPPHHSLPLPSCIRHGRPDSEHLYHLHGFFTRTKPCLSDLDDESLLQNQHFGHGDRDDEKNQLFCCSCHRPLELIGVQISTLCYLCNKVPSAYFCAPCPRGLINFFDRRCAELPKEIRYPYHPHPLAIRIRKKATCSVCHQSCRSFNYGCDGCSFTVDIKCAIREIKKYEGPSTSMRKFMALMQDL